MSTRTDAEFEKIIHDDLATPDQTVESDDAKHLRADLEPAHADEEDTPGVEG